MKIDVPDAAHRTVTTIGEPGDAVAMLVIHGDRQLVQMLRAVALAAVQDAMRPVAAAKPCSGCGDR